MTTARGAVRKPALHRWPNLAALILLAFAPVGLFSQTPARPQVFPLRDASGLIAPSVKTGAVTYLGRKSVRITIDGDDHAGLALLGGWPTFGP